MDKYTAGLWRYNKRRHCVSSPNPAPGIAGSDEVEYYDGHMICESVNEPNGRLIAAAPDMLEILDSLENDDGAIPPAMWNRILEVTAKAKGEIHG